MMTSTSEELEDVSLRKSNAKLRQKRTAIKHFNDYSNRINSIYVTFDDISENTDRNQLLEEFSDHLKSEVHIIIFNTQYVYI
jgi:hypothetical protein